jgi:hypothetical protein
MSDGQLMKYFDFEESDLHANQNTHLSEKQKARLLNLDKFRKRKGVANGGCLFVIALPGLLITLGSLFFLPGSNKGVYLILGLFWLALWGALGIYVMRSVFAGFNEKVHKAEGPINLVKVEKSYRKKYRGTQRAYFSTDELHIGGKIFDVIPEVASLMGQGDVYTVYYLEGSMSEILSAELLEKAG